MTDSKGRMKRQNSNATSQKRQPPQAKEGWLCHRADCRAACRKIVNYPTNKKCFDCQRDKCSAMNPPLASCVHWARRKQLPSENAQNQGSPSSPAAAPPATPPSKPAPPAQSADTSGKKSSWTKLSLSPEELASIAGIKDAASDALSSLSAERVPLLAEDMADASAVFAKLTESVAPCASLAKQAELDSEVHALQAAIMSLDPLRDAKIISSIEERLHTAREQRDKVTKKTPTDAALQSALKEARSSYERAIQDRHDRMAAGIAKANERKQARRQGLAKLRQELDSLESLLDAKESHAAQAFSAMNATQTTVETTVLGLFDAKLSTLGTQSSAERGDVLMTATGPQTQALAVTATPVDNGIRQAASVVEAQLREAQEELQRTLDTLEAQKAYIAAENSFNATMDIADIQPPKVKLEDDNERAAATLWLHFLEHWSKSGGVEHFTINMVEMHAQDASIAMHGFLLKLLGDAVWERWTPPQAKDHAVVPRQVAMLAHSALKRLQAECAEQRQREAIQLAAGNSFAQVTDQNKKRRAGI